MRLRALTSSVAGIVNRARLYDGNLDATTRGRVGRTSWSTDSTSAA